MASLRKIHKDIAKAMIRDAHALGITIAGMADLFQRVPQAAQMARENPRALRKILDDLKGEYRNSKNGESNVDQETERGTSSSEENELHPQGSVDPSVS